MTNLDKTIDEVCEKLFSLPPDELMGLIVAHKEGDIALAIEELNTLNVGNLEAQITQEYFEDGQEYHFKQPDIDVAEFIFSTFISINPEDIQKTSPSFDKFRKFTMKINLNEPFVSNTNILSVEGSTPRFRRVSEQVIFEEQELWPMAA